LSANVASLCSRLSIDSAPPLVVVERRLGAACFTSLSADSSLLASQARAPTSLLASQAQVPSCRRFSSLSLELSTDLQILREMCTSKKAVHVGAIVCFCCGTQFIVYVTKDILGDTNDRLTSWSKIMLGVFKGSPIHDHCPRGFHTIN
jgi:hypothetical protein